MTLPTPSGPVPPNPAVAAAQPFLGIVMLDTQFPRPPGDIGHDATFAVHTRKVMLRGAWPEKVVQTAASLRKERAVEPLKILVRQLVARGAKAVTTSCGFLVLLQAELQSTTKVPVITSSLLQLPGLLRQPECFGARIGVLTISAAKLGVEHLRAAGVARDALSRVVIEGMPAQGEFASAILGNRATMDLQLALAEVLACARALQARAPDVRTVVLECTNMPPYAQAIVEATGWQLRTLLDDERLFRPFGLTHGHPVPADLQAAAQPAPRAAGQSAGAPGATSAG